ncbi:flagellar basal body-associated FliL family protein [Dethiobacter alkaliphilus]|uniref:Flagellar protein FliL n=1 Tax=Dethiobacter alkaliphilus AHT 1 TaxID=555088 RepID=C0GJH1_DETAL|nr:flagellar basal body-associated FliL family protein [Dethiobacter alkaliphilus]EEG76518.1 flagellar basal body-associated protein FliL [Dethiobacter alkaliphilus AHT 1]
MSKAEENSAPKKGSRTNLLLAIVAVLALMGVVISVYALLADREEPLFGGGAQAEEEVAGPFRQFGPLDFTVNLSDSGQRNYLKATITLAYEERRLAGELEERKAQIRDLIINTMRSKAVNDVSDGDGTEKLRGELIEEVNSVLSGGEIVEIYFTDFLVQ